MIKSGNYLVALFAALILGSVTACGPNEPDTGSDSTTMEGSSAPDVMDDTTVLPADSNMSDTAPTTPADMTGNETGATTDGTTSP